MKEEITICKRENDKLVVVDTKRLKVEIDESSMELACRYQGKRYIVNGNIYTQYIIIE